MWDKAQYVESGGTVKLYVPLVKNEEKSIGGIWYFTHEGSALNYRVLVNSQAKPDYEQYSWMIDYFSQELYGHSMYNYKEVIQPDSYLKGVAPKMVSSHCVDMFINNYYKGTHCWDEFTSSGGGGGRNFNPSHGGSTSTNPTPKPEPDPKVELDTSITKNPKLSCLWDKIMAVGIGKRNPLIINFLANFSNTFSTNNISIIAMPGLKSESGQEFYAQTNAKDINNIKIYLNSDYVNNRSSIEVALTLAHEVVHANLFRYYKNSEDNFYTMFADYIKITKNKVFFDQHELMRQEYIPILANFLRQFDSLNGLSDSNENYIKLAMDGLEKTNTEIKTSIDIENYFRTNRGLNCK